MTSEVRTFTPQQVAHRLLCATLKAAVKADRPRLRALNTESKEAQRKGDNGPRSTFYIERGKARARFLVYGFVRGHSWDKMERNHPNGDGINYWWKRHYLKRAWEEAIAATPEWPVAAMEIPEQLREYV